MQEWYNTNKKKDPLFLAKSSLTEHGYKHAVGGRPPRYAPPLSSLRGRRSALRRQADGNVAAVSHDQHAHRCSRLTPKHGGEQSGLVTLTLKVV